MAHMNGTRAGILLGLGIACGVYSVTMILYKSLMTSGVAIQSYKMNLTQQCLHCVFSISRQVRQTSESYTSRVSGSKS